jgi:hypothetical protein
MSHEKDSPVTFELALARYKQGKCPCCGKGVGEPRGLENRSKFGDIYCHTCRRSWSIEMDPEDLRVELSPLESLDANTVSILPDTEGESGPSYKPAGLTKRLGNFLKGIGRGVK